MQHRSMSASAAQRCHQLLRVRRSRRSSQQAGQRRRLCCARRLPCSLGGCCPAGTTGEDVRRSVRVGKLNLVDLAGSERVHITGATGRKNSGALRTLKPIPSH